MGEIAWIRILLRIMSKRRYIERVNHLSLGFTTSILVPLRMQYISTERCSIYTPWGGWVSKVRVELLKRKLAVRYGIHASPNAIIGKGLRFVHPTSVVIGSCVTAGENLSLYQNTTIGGARTGDVNKGNQPTIGDNVTLFANSLILGKVTVGNNVILGANSLLLKSVPDNTICVGTPATNIKEKENYKNGTL